MNNNIKRCMKKAKENWIGEQCSEIEENLRKNNSKRSMLLLSVLSWSKRAYKLVRETRNKGSVLLSKIVQENASLKNDRY